MDQRDDPFQFENGKGIVTHRARRFGRQSAIPVVGMKPITDLDLLDLIDDLSKKSAITDQLFFLAQDTAELTRSTRLGAAR